MELEWNKAKELLPKRDDKNSSVLVLCYDTHEVDYFVGYCMYQTKEWYNNDSCSLVFSEHLYWMYLPEFHYPQPKNPRIDGED